MERRRFGHLPLVALAVSLALRVVGLPAGAAAAAGEAFSHAEWEAVLVRFVDARGDVDYQGLARDRARLDRYLAAIAARSPRSHPALFPTRAEQLAYWLNAYNAQVFNGVLARGPEGESVWSPLGTGYSFFVGMDITLGGESTNLKALEDDWIRAVFRDPRVHAALNCASKGCPRLPQKAFAAATLDADLDAGMKEFVGEARNCQVDAAARTVTLSKIFDWFADDFLDWERRQGNTSPSVVDYVNRYRAASAQIPRDYRVKFFDYDKGINAQ